MHLSANAPTAKSENTRRPRHDGWLVHRQRAFLEAIAGGTSVEAACAAVGMSPASAYAFRRSLAGEAFSLAWEAANLHARHVVHDQLMACVYAGYETTITQVSGGIVTRQRPSHRLALVMLNRLEKNAAGLGADKLVEVRLVAREFDVFLDLMETGSGPQVTAAFLAERMPKPEAPRAAEPTKEAREETRHTPQLHSAAEGDDAPAEEPAEPAQAHDFAELYLVHNDEAAPARQAVSPAPCMNRAARRASAAKRRHG